MPNDKLAILDRLFNPAGVAVIGVTGDPDRVGYCLLESLVYAGFKGRIYPVHPRLDSLLGLPVYRSLDELPGPVDLAVIGVNQYATVDMVEQCGQKGIPGVVCIAGGYREMGAAGEALEERLIAAARRYNMALVGPNTLGIINTAAGLNTSFYPMRLPVGRVSLISQSGGVGLTILQKASDEGLGINKWVGVGNRSTLELSDYLEYLARDRETGVIGIFLEGTDDARRLVKTAAAAARQKPVVIYKAGRSEAVNFAAVSHTGSMAGSYRIYRQIFAQHGLLVAESVAELVAACKALAIAPLPAGNRLGVITHTAGPSIVMLDEVVRREVEISSFQPATIETIKAALGENPAVVIKNPLDAAGHGMLAASFGRLADAVAGDPGVDLVAAVYCLHLHWRFPSRELLAVRRRTGKPLLALYVGTQAGVREERDYLQAGGIPVYLTAEEAAWGAAALAHYGIRRRGEN
ncbi:acetate--CoA ligase family protein [Desulfotomaculum copahuensis]|uniref:CoA-binding domain-containing protein n=1 Tax=Desulfotomaculum copahuensis TaxID=1838280 RepID=A0A1B7LDP8_9FIRM|nr:CoA-binding protein [Desulfotomaculum copahuensis]OAT81181.1 hypothetical protein A6M21_11630 [Desulfotomaculum copahuensis]